MSTHDDLDDLAQDLNARKPVYVDENGRLVDPEKQPRACRGTGQSRHTSAPESAAARLKDSTWFSGRHWPLREARHNGRDGLTVVPARLAPAQWNAWYDSDPLRLRKEREAMSKHFPGFTLVRGKAGQLGWVGWLTSNRGRRYRAFVDYSEDHPYSPPAAYILDPPIGRGLPSQHAFGDGRLCLMHPSDDTWQTKSTSAVIVTLVSAWIFAYETHAAKCRGGADGAPCLDPKCGHWPGPKK